MSSSPVANEVTSRTRTLSAPMPKLSLAPELYVAADQPTDRRWMDLMAGQAKTPVAVGSIATSKYTL